MDYRVDIDNENEIVLCTCTGVLDLASAKSMTRDVRKRAFGLGYQLLHDVTNVSVGIKIADAYSFPLDMENIYEDFKHRQGKVALVYKEDAEFWKFFETTARNAGVSILVFCEMEAAMNWLIGEQPS